MNYPCEGCGLREGCDGEGCKLWIKWVRDRWEGLRKGYRQVSWTQYIRQLVEETER